MFRRRALVLVGLLAPGTVLFGLRPAEAADRFAVVGIENTTRATIHLQHRWGDGQWSEDVLAPGARKWYWHEYARADENKSPPFNVRFDSDLSPGRFTEKYHLKKNSAPAHDWNYAHKYVFRYDGNSKFIELFEAA